MRHKPHIPSDPKAAFKTHSRYFQAFHTIIAITAGSYRPILPPSPTKVAEGLVARVTSAAFYTNLTTRATFDAALLRRILRNAWGTEFLLAADTALPDDELLCLANNWEVIQAYYAAYHAAQALIVASGQPRPDSHPKTLHTFSSYWVKDSIDLPPWSLGFRFNQRLGFPPPLTSRRVTNWTDCDRETCWELAAMALRTTREDLLDERNYDERQRMKKQRRDEWKRGQDARAARGLRHRTVPPRRLDALPRVPQQRQDELDESLCATTLMDYLARMRLRSNYEDPTMFTDGPDSPSESRAVHRHVSGIATATLLVHELAIAKLIGIGKLIDIADEWLATDAFHTRYGLAARRHLIAAV